MRKRELPPVPPFAWTFGILLGLFVIGLIAIGAAHA